jgi:hypothetical protein
MKKFILAVCLMTTMPAFGQAIEEKNLLSGKTRIESDSGYMLITGPARSMGMFLKMPDAQDKAEYEARWAEELQKEKKKYVKKLSSWERDVSIAKTTKVKLPEKPVEPTEENFSIGPIELLNPVNYGPQFIYSKIKEPEQFAYLHKVKPGTYVYYGPIMLAQAAMGTCYCMGSVQFEVKPGVITDLGNFIFAAPRNDPAFPRDNSDPKGSQSGLYGVYFGSPPEQPPLAFGVPSSLKAYSYRKAEFRASPKLENFYGITVSRLPPVPGVLGYDRDRPMDIAPDMEQGVSGSSVGK